MNQRPSTSKFTLMALVAIAFGVSAQETEDNAPTMSSETTNSGAIAVSPSSAVSGVFGTWTVTYTVGPESIPAGGGIRVQMPDDFHAGPRNSANRLQASHSKADHYVSADASRAGVELNTLVEHESEYILVKHPKPSLDGRYERYVFVVRVEVAEGELREGDTITVTYGDKSEGSRGYRAGAVSTPELPVLVALDTDGDNVYRLHEDRASFQIHPGDPTSMQLHGPTRAIVGGPLKMTVALLDKESNPIDDAREIRIAVREGSADAPDRVSVPAGQGYATFTATPTAEGIVRLRATSPSDNLSAISNPADVTAHAPEHQILWGELHSHTHYSWDGVGRSSFDYARHVTALDFYTMTDHAMAPTDQGTKGLHTGNWPAYADEVEAHHDAPAFVTLHAYECSFGGPWGHHNVFFRHEPGPLMYPGEVSLPDLWDALEAGDALTIPHHTGKFPSGVKFSPQNPEFRRNFEIYSGHGLSEVYNPDHPLAFEQSKFTSDSTSLDAPTHAQDVWAQGLRLSTVAASDDHRAQPGKPYYGLTAVYAPENTRDAVFDALINRRTYGTTGAKILLAFRMNGHPMGAIVENADTAEFDLRAIGTDPIETVELLRNLPGEDAFTVIHDWSPGSATFEAAYTDPEFQNGATYYIRLRQANTVGGRIVMAWSSPIWTE